MKKNPFQQLRGTPGQKARHRFCLYVTLGSFASAFALGWIMYLVKKPPLDWQPGRVARFRDEGFRTAQKHGLENPNKEQDPAQVTAA